MPFAGGWSLARFAGRRGDGHLVAGGWAAIRCRAASWVANSLDLRPSPTVTAARQADDHRCEHETGRETLHDAGEIEGGFGRTAEQPYTLSVGTLAESGSFPMPPVLHQGRTGAAGKVTFVVKP